jgi:uncharacterized protein
MSRLFGGAVLLAACAVCAFGPARAANEDIAAAARQQLGVTIHYDPTYRRLAYPGGDVPADRGVCTDVIVRALRVARAIDLQKRVHEDLAAHVGAYPLQRWGNPKPDASIDHRRVPNLMKYFERAGLAVATTRNAADYLPGDIVAWDLGRGVLHIGIVSDRVAPTLAPFIVHNIGAGVREEDILFRFAVMGHYRLPTPGNGAQRR